MLTLKKIHGPDPNFSKKANIRMDSGSFTDSSVCNSAALARSDPPAAETNQLIATNSIIELKKFNINW